MLFLAPNLVQLDQAIDVAADPETYRRYAQGRVATPPPGSRGTLGYPSRATAAKGEAVFYRYVQELTEILTREPTSPRSGMNFSEVKVDSPGDERLT
jgi:hypothetical protein